MKQTNPSSRTLSRTAMLLFSAGTALLAGARATASPSQTGAALTAHGSEKLNAIADAPLEKYRIELLDLAFEAASAIPLEPHIKDRSRAQEAVVIGCFELDQPIRASSYIAEIENWRRGAAHADLASYCAKHGDAEQARVQMDLALRAADSSMDESSQSWRRERILAKVARTSELLEQMKKTGEQDTSEPKSKPEESRSEAKLPVEAKEFEAKVAALGNSIRAGDFEQGQAALEVLARLFDHNYQSLERRSRVEAEIKASWSRLPIVMHIDLMLKLASFALDHADRNNALALLEQARLIMDGSQWTAEHQIPVMSRLALAYGNADDMDRARKVSDAALAMYDAKREEILTIYRARMLRSVAEAYQAVGAAATARTLYERAVEEGAHNPNARPRAEDLSATCVSMAVHGVEPGTALWTRMRAIRKELSAPW